jgi:hypothetical protein
MTHTQTGTGQCFAEIPLSPRGDWRAPGDSEATVWLDELKRNVPQA